MCSTGGRSIDCSVLSPGTWMSPQSWQASIALHPVIPCLSGSGAWCIMGCCFRCRWVRPAAKAVKADWFTPRRLPLRTQSASLLPLINSSPCLWTVMVSGPDAIKAVDHTLTMLTTESLGSADSRRTVNTIELALHRQAGVRLARWSLVSAERLWLSALQSLLTQC